MHTPRACSAALKAAVDNDERSTQHQRRMEASARKLTLAGGSSSSWMGVQSSNVSSVGAAVVVVGSRRRAARAWGRKQKRKSKQQQPVLRRRPPRRERLLLRPTAALLLAREWVAMAADSCPSRTGDASRQHAVGNPIPVRWAPRKTVGTGNQFTSQAHTPHVTPGARRAQTLADPRDNYPPAVPAEAMEPSLASSEAVVVQINPAAAELERRPGAGEAERGPTAGTESAASELPAEIAGPSGRGQRLFYIEVTRGSTNRGQRNADGPQQNDNNPGESFGSAITQAELAAAIQQEVERQAEEGTHFDIVVHVAEADAEGAIRRGQAFNVGDAQLRELCLDGDGDEQKRCRICLGCALNAPLQRK